MYYICVVEGLFNETVFLPENLALKMDGRVIKSDVSPLFNQYWRCKKFTSLNGRDKTKYIPASMGS